MVKSAKLIDDDGYTIMTFQQGEEYELSADGEIRIVQSWDSETLTPYESSYFASLSVKWDGCSHIYFYGEDYNADCKEDRDSYYHLCGIGSYINFMRALAFAYEIMVEHVGVDNVLEIEELEELRGLDLLKKYKLIFE